MWIGFWLVQGAADGEGTEPVDMGVVHGGFDVRLAKEFLHGVDVVAGFEQVGGEGVAEDVRGDVFVDFGGFDGLTHGLLHAAFVEVVADDAGARVDGKAIGGEDVLPDPLAPGVGVFAIEGRGEADFGALEPMGDKLVHAGETVNGVLFVMKQNEALDSIDIRIFGTDGVVLEADLVANLIEKFDSLLIHLTYFGKLVHFRLSVLGNGVMPHHPPATGAESFRFSGSGRTIYGRFPLLPLVRW